MTDDSQSDVAPANAKAKEVAPTHEERAAALVAEFEHAMKHNAPVTIAMMTELRALLIGA